MFQFVLLLEQAAKVRSAGFVLFLSTTCSTTSPTGGGGVHFVIVDVGNAILFPTLIAPSMGLPDVSLT